ncbi:molybdenum cofactor guanylyltransferase [Alkalimonas amylolytica]|uniref:Molybdopterin-guanine dinucleotide biosynthesis protein A n=1 Tax=Alkalimonas amylolytica TaxID=152573 RepID=A0A1H3ZNH0_ALKAM|nr:molybdenum cofactor guanylyltransferase [Alkalimonas amylolytica]SEA25207.1 molybdopterin-guanine dinucleotide biosynthesis protein A [Alkalimonas amylolytica]
MSVPQRQDPTPFDAILLAGGKSSRMGTDKAELNWQGQPLWQHMQALAKEAGASEVFVSRNAAGFMPDRFAKAGPLAGIEAGLNRCRHDRVLVLAIDTPLLSVTDIQQLVGVNSHKAACFSGHPLPCVLPNSLSLHRYLQQVLTKADSNRSVQALLSAIGFETCQPVHAAALNNTNTPAEWQQALQLASEEFCDG